ncbi:MAG: hypothetical protein V4710_00960 [Verrucomicrobiota bacterium]
MKPIAENLWVKRYPLRLFGAELGRTVTVIRLEGGELLIHSTAPFSEADVSAIRTLGKPAWLVEAALYHDTYAAKGHRAFLDLPYLAPPGFAKIARVPAQPLQPPPEAWSGQVDVLPIGGMPKGGEHLFFHRASKTLIVADLLFNQGSHASGWTLFLLRVASGLKQYPGMSRIFIRQIRDRDAFVQSMRALMEWDFKRIIVAHGEIVEGGGRKKMADALQSAGFNVRF